MFSLDEYDAAHRSAVVADSQAGGIVAVTGADRRAFLHGLLTQDVATLKAGQGAYAAYLTPQGRMITDMRVIETGDQVLLAVETSVGPALAARLDTLVFSEDVQITDLTGELEDVRVCGPTSSGLISRALGASVAGLDAPHDNRVGAGCTIVRNDAFGVRGFDIYVAAAESRNVRDRLLHAEAIRISDDTLDTLRLEAGTPRFGVDMDSDTIPLEAGIENRAISFTKGCYVGQEVIVRIMHRGHGRVARRLVRLTLPALPSAGDQVFDGGQAVGHVTSAAQSPRVGSPMAMAYVRREHAVPGTILTVNGSTAVVYQGSD